MDRRVQWLWCFTTTLKVLGSTTPMSTVYHTQTHTHTYTHTHNHTYTHTHTQDAHAGQNSSLGIQLVAGRSLVQCQVLLANESR